MQQTLEQDVPVTPAGPPVGRTTSVPKVLWAVLGAVLVVARLLGPVLFDDPYAHAPWVLGVWLLGPLLVVGIAWWAVGHLHLTRVLPPMQRCVVVVLAVALFVVQHWPVQLDAYPFASWSMYTAPADTAEYTEFQMLSAGEPVGHLPVADLVPNTLGRAFMFGLSDWVDRAEAGDEHAADVVERTMRLLMDRLEDPDVDAVAIRWCHVDSPTPAAPARCDTAVTVPR